MLAELASHERGPIVSEGTVHALLFLELATCTVMAIALRYGVTNTVVRWLFCFIVLPGTWLTLGGATGLHAVIMIPTAVVASSLAAATAYVSDRRARAAVAYFVVTGAMIGVAFVAFLAVALTYYCLAC